LFIFCFLWSRKIFKGNFFQHNVELNTKFHFPIVHFQLSTQWDLEFDYHEEEKNGSYKYLCLKWVNEKKLINALAYETRRKSWLYVHHCTKKVDATLTFICKKNKIVTAPMSVAESITMKTFIEWKIINK
jgi:hypothetical protein